MIRGRQYDPPNCLIDKGAYPIIAQPRGNFRGWIRSFILQWTFSEGTWFKYRPNSCYQQKDNSKGRNERREPSLSFSIYLLSVPHGVLICVLGFNTTHRDLALVRCTEKLRRSFQMPECYDNEVHEVTGSDSRNGRLLRKGDQEGCLISCHLSPDFIYWGGQPYEDLGKMFQAECTVNSKELRHEQTHGCVWERARTLSWPLQWKAGEDWRKMWVVMLGLSGQWRAFWFYSIWYGNFGSTLKKALIHVPKIQSWLFVKKRLLVGMRAEVNLEAFVVM